MRWLVALNFASLLLQILLARRNLQVAERSCQNMILKYWTKICWKLKMIVKVFCSQDGPQIVFTLKILVLRLELLWMVGTVLTMYFLVMLMDITIATEEKTT